jgi:Mg-chelatase subunit ChlD
MSQEQPQPPEEYVCPITQELMRDPVVGTDGHTYERLAITQALELNPQSPMTRQRMTANDLKTNYALRAAIERWQGLITAAATVTLSAATPPKPREPRTFFASAARTDDKTVVSIGSTQTQPLDTIVIAVLDVSGSMEGTASSASNAQEQTTFSRLALVKHSMKTVAAMLNSRFSTQTTSLGIVTFSDTARVVMPITPMNTTTLVNQVIDSIRAGGSTNIWDGLRLALDLAEQANAQNPNATVHIAVLTDGEPTPSMLPPRGLTDTLSRRLAKPGLKVTISAFGFGYQLDTILLNDIAYNGRGTFCFIPDCSMVGTGFINWCSKALLTAAQNVSVEIDGVKQRMGDIMLGTTQTVIVDFKWSTGPVLLRADNENSKILEPTAMPDDQITRHLTLQRLRRVVRAAATARSFADVSFTSFNTLYNQINGSNPTDSVLLAALQDIQSDDPNEGQLLKSVSREDWYNAWGRNHLMAYAIALSRSATINFKDKVLQHFMTPEFATIQEQGIDLFSALPAPTPDIHGWRSQASAAAAPVNMSQYVQASGGCFAGESHALMNDGSKKQVHNLKKGDILHGGAQIQCVVYTPLNYPDKYVRLDTGLIITPWHPIYMPRIGWQFPCMIGTRIIHSLSGVYNLVLDKIHIAILNDTQVCTLGHGLVGSPVIEHEYFGTQRVIEDLKQKPGWNEGFIVLDPTHQIRDADTGNVIHI